MPSRLCFDGLTPPFLLHRTRLNSPLGRKEIHDAASGETQPRVNFPPYRSSLLRHPTKALRHADPEGCELLAPVFGHSDVAPVEADLTIQHTGDPVGERMVVTGRVLDGDGDPVADLMRRDWMLDLGKRRLWEVFDAQYADRVGAPNFPSRLLIATI